jgi:hypothetical protein
MYNCTLYNLHDRLVVLIVPAERILPVKIMLKGTLLDEPIPCKKPQNPVGRMCKNHFPGFFIGLKMVPVDWFDR